MAGLARGPPAQPDHPDVRAADAVRDADDVDSFGPVAAQECSFRTIFECPYLARSSSSEPVSGPALPLEVYLLRKFEGVIDLDAHVADGALQLSVAQEKLARSEIAGLLVDHRDLGPPHTVRSVRCRIEVDHRNPLIDQPCVLPRTDMLPGSASARKQPLACDKTTTLQPRR